MQRFYVTSYAKCRNPVPAATWAWFCGWLHRAGQRISGPTPNRNPHQRSVIGHDRTARNDVPRALGLGIAGASCGRAGVACVTWLVTLVTHGDTGPPVGDTFRFVGLFVGTFGRGRGVFTARCDS